VSAFCLVHGAWHGASCWGPLSERLRARGHEVSAPDLPLHDPGAGYEQRIRPALGALATHTGPLVVVGHSLGSAYAPLIAAAHPGSLLVHLCPRLGPFAPPAGAPSPFRPGIPWPSERGDGTSSWAPERAVAVLYSRLAPATARAAAARLRPLAPLAEEYPLPGHPDVPTALIYAAQDELFEPAWERFMARELLGVEPIEIEGGHFPMLENPDALADLLERLADAHARAWAASPR
jgi:pimeloyl-ACP methyl ester carboxylesterase